MENENKRTAWYYPSKVISYIMHPFLMPLWFLVLLFATGIVPLYLPAPIRNYLFLVVGVDTLLVPIMAVVLMKVFGLISDYSLESRSDRTMPMLVVALCYGLCAWMLSSVPMFFLFQRLMWAATICTVFALCVNLGWQISLHLIAAGAFVAGVLVLLIAGYPNMVWIFCLSVLLAGALGSARLCLEKHSPAQIAAGFFGGFIITALVMLLWAW